MKNYKTFIINLLHLARKPYSAVQVTHTRRHKSYIHIEAQRLKM